MHFKLYTIENSSWSIFDTHYTGRSKIQFKSECIMYMTEITNYHTLLI